jgi:threonine aldolase
VTPVSFASDNHAGVHPLLFAEMEKVNHGYASSYEQDPWSQKLRKVILDEFQAADCALVFNGTAANVLCLQMGLKSYQAVLCSDQSHLWLDECGAPEKIAGVKLITLPGDHGKLRPEIVETAIVRRGDQHHSQIKMLSITQPTEYGTLYALDELHELRELCDRYDLYLHMDGARLANAAVALNCDFKTLVAPVDLLSFGGAKNGLLLGEFVVVRKSELKEGLRYFRKQSLQLPAKTRFLAAPFLKYLDNSFWAEIAQHENHMAQNLAEKLRTIPQITLTRPVQANAVFCRLPRDLIKDLRKDYFFYVWDEKTFEVRLMTSFATQPEDIDGFVNRLQSLLAAKDTL